jgi:hypothetical protein
MDRRRGWETIPDFNDALAAEPNEVEEFWWGRGQYVRHGRYANSVRQYQEAFAGDQLKIMFYDDLIADSRENSGQHPRRDTRRAGADELCNAQSSGRSVPRGCACTAIAA